jgi:hypothetical protein
MSRKQQYGRYLRSPEWHKKRDLALARSSGFCEFCGDFAKHVHHVRYPKVLGEEHPDALFPVCERCHEKSHGIRKMNELTNVVKLKTLAPTGRKFRYVVSEARVFASAESWIDALQMPEGMQSWFKTSLKGNSILKSKPGNPLEMMCEGRLVYRWHAVAESLRSFDRQFYAGAFQDKPTNARRAIEQFHANYEKIVSWGQDLQESAMASVLNAKREITTGMVTEAALVAVVREALAPRLRGYDDKLEEHDVVIADIKKVVPVFRDPHEYVTVKQAITEKGYNASEVPLYPQSRENLSGLAGQLLALKKVEQGEKVPDRLDGVGVTTLVNTYRRGDIFEVLDEIMLRRPAQLPFKAA